MQKLVYDTLHMERSFCRSCILPQFVGCFAQIYNGKGFFGLKITREMVGHEFGEFASTRKTSSFAKRALPSKTKIKPIKKVR